MPGSGQADTPQGGHFEIGRLALFRQKPSMVIGSETFRYLLSLKSPRRWLASCRAVVWRALAPMKQRIGEYHFRTSTASGLKALLQRQQPGLKRGFSAIFNRPKPDPACR
jgi:hypothetical protein